MDRARKEETVAALKQIFSDSNAIVVTHFSGLSAGEVTDLRAKMVDAALDGFCTLVDASDLVSLLRLVKSSAELDYVRKAGALSDKVLEVSVEKTVPGASVKSIHGAMFQALLEGGGDVVADAGDQNGDGLGDLVVSDVTGDGVRSLLSKTIDEWRNLTFKGGEIGRRKPLEDLWDGDVALLFGIAENHAKMDTAVVLQSMRAGDR